MELPSKLRRFEHKSSPKASLKSLWSGVTEKPVDSERALTMLFPSFVSESPPNRTVQLNELMFWGVTYNWESHLGNKNRVIANERHLLYLMPCKIFLSVVLTFHTRDITGLVTVWKQDAKTQETKSADVHR